MLTLISAVCGENSVTRRFLETTVANCETEPELIIVSNGSTDAENRELLSWMGPYATLITRPQPMGSTAALNLGSTYATGDLLAFVHNDAFIVEAGWDVKVDEFFRSHPEAGMAGPAGAKRIGRDDIYRSPYQLVQLARGDVYTSLVEWEPHGAHATEPIPVAVLDGLAMFCRRADFEAVGRMDEGLGPHHMYDVDLTVRTHLAGLTNYVLPVQTIHRSGQTANGSRYQAKHGPDAEVHRVAHERFYAKFMGRLPVVVP